MLKKGLQRSIRVYTCQNATLLETTCHGSIMYFLFPGEWLHWTNRVEEYIYSSEVVPEFSSILVPNVDNVRSNFLIDTIAKQHKVIFPYHTGIVIRESFIGHVKIPHCFVRFKTQYCCTSYI